METVSSTTLPAVIDVRDDWAVRQEAAILDAALPLADALGWSAPLVRAAGDAVGLSNGDVQLLLPEGPRDLAALLARRHDAVAQAELAGVDPAQMKIRERIRRGVIARVEAAAVNPGATRRWLGFLALPANTALGLRLVWETADSLWRWAGDVAADENHYSKRALLSEILLSTLAVRLASGPAAAESHLDRRISAVMAFETWKARLPSGAAAAERLAGVLGGLRYGLRFPGRAARAG